MSHKPLYQLNDNALLILVRLLFTFRFTTNTIITIELQQQRKLAMFLESGGEEDIDRSLRTLILLSYGTEIELKEKSGLLDTLVRIIQKGRDCPQPPQVIFAAGSENICQFPFLEPVEVTDSEEDSIRRVYEEYFTVCSSEKRKKMHRKSQAMKIILNLSFISRNKSVLAKHLSLTSLVIEMLQESSRKRWAAEILSNIGKHIQISSACSCLPGIAGLLYSDAWSIVLVALEFFKKSTQLVRAQILAIFYYGTDFVIE